MGFAQESVAHRLRREGAEGHSEGYGGSADLYQRAGWIWYVAGPVPYPLHPPPSSSRLHLEANITLTAVSACHGAGDDPISSTCYPARFFSWWNSIFPHPASELTNGAQRQTDSAYFAYCSRHHLPDQTDLIILEFDAADPK